MLMVPFILKMAQLLLVVFYGMNIESELLVFSRSIGKYSVLLTKLWMIHDLLHHLWNFGYLKVMVELDNLEVVKII
ncbi:hypothetical protein GQ457_01G026600 [Hibiscus cannabinus]